MHLILASSNIGWPEITAIIGVVSAAVLAFIGVRKLGPEKDSIYISTAQGAAVIMEGLVETLRKELERERKIVEALQAENTRLRTENHDIRERIGLQTEVADLKIENKSLRKNDKNND